MASPVQAPPMRPRRSVAGPAVLILLGGVLLLATTGVLPWGPLLRRFGVYWPALIILWGIIKLVEYQQAQREGVRATGIGGGGVFLLIVLIVSGMAANQMTRINWDEIRDNIQVGDEDFTLFGHNYSYENQLQQDFPAGASLRILSDRGAVNVAASNDNQIHVVAHKRINADSQQEADRLNPNTKPQLSVSGLSVTLNANSQGAGQRTVTTDMDVMVPRKAPVVISSHRGDVSVLGRDGDVEVSSQRGEVTTSDINGKVTLNMVRDTARVSGVNGDVAVQGRAGDVSLEEVKGAARLSGEFDTIKLSKISGPVSFNSARTDLQFSKLGGDIDMDSGDMRGSNLTGPLRLLTRSKDIRLAGVDGDVRLENENGAVEVRINKLGNVQVSNRNSDVQLYLPDKASFQVDARSRGGEIQSDFEGLKVNSGDEQATASGTIGTGGPKLVINNEHGDIELRKGSIVAEDVTPPKPPRVPAPPKPPVPTEN
jgi:DUF4097 and DUF4098 domain-containing protein YvlB